jgi:hypothetical protein
MTIARNIFPLFGGMLFGLILILALIVGWTIGSVASSHLEAPYNATDDAAAEVRSGMRLHTDHETGCQYLSIRSAGLTPRLAADGSHMGCR